MSRASQHSTFRPRGTQHVAVTATTAQSAAISANIFEIRVVGTQDMYLEIGENPVAVINGGSLLLPAGVVEYFHVSPGQLVAAIRVSADGTLNITEMSR